MPKLGWTKWFFCNRCRRKQKFVYIRYGVLAYKYAWKCSVCGKKIRIK